MTELAYINGVFCPIADARVSIEDRGFQFGDGVYEVVVAYDGRPFLLDEHLARLRRSLAAIGLDYDPDPVEGVIAEGLERSGLGDAMIYLQITRGADSRNHPIPAGLTPTVVMTFKPRPVVPDDLRRQGARVMTTMDTRWANCYVKAITLLPNILAKTEALKRGCDDAIFVTGSGEVRECTAANLFVVRRGSIQIPPRTEAILRGVTQGFVIDCAGGIGLEVQERAFNVDVLREADEVFMSGTTVEVLAITTIDDRPVGDGCVGPITDRLYAEFLKRVRGLRSHTASPSPAAS